MSLLACGVLLALGAGIVLTWQSKRDARTVAEQITGGNSEAGEAHMRRFGCGACHEISGVSAARGLVGPSLTGIAERTELAGKLANTPENMIRWIKQPQSVEPDGGMPDMGVSEKQARDISAYLYTLRKPRPNK